MLGPGCVCWAAALCIRPPRVVLRCCCNLRADSHNLFLTFLASRCEVFKDGLLLNALHYWAAILACLASLDRGSQSLTASALVGRLSGRLSIPELPSP